MVGGDEVPDSLIVSIGLDDAEVRGFPSNPHATAHPSSLGCNFAHCLETPTARFFVGDAATWPPFESTLNQKNLPIVGAPSLERIPQNPPTIHGRAKIGLCQIGVNPSSNNAASFSESGPAMQGCMSVRGIMA